MPEKLTYEFVKESFESGGYTLLSDDYINSSTKLDYRCSKGHEHSMIWTNWKKGNRCSTCAGNTKLNLEYIKESFENEGYTLLSTEYINSLMKLDYRCPKGHEHSISWSCWQRCHRCITCFGNTKPTFEQVRESFESKGYTLLSTEYVNSTTKLDYRCPKGHEHNIIWNAWQRGHRCFMCYGTIKLTLDQVRESFKNEGYTLLSEKYVNNKTKLYYRCSEGHEHSITWHDWSHGYKCPFCSRIRQSIRQTGPGNPVWNGGTSYEPYCPIWSDKEYKKDIRLRDGNKCLNPTCNKKDSRLHIHHIDYNKKSCSPINVITLCGSCNTIANTDREWHIAWYQALMYMRYKYKY
jgi:hypothetical protein